MKPILEKYNKGKFFVDTKKLDIIDFYEGMYIFPNKKEMDALLEYNNLSTRNGLRIKMNLDFIIETASEEGAFLYKDDGKIIHCPAYNTNFNSIYGAGDIFIGAFALYYTKFQSKIKALEFANYCCSKAVMKKDRCYTNINEVKDFIKGAY
jgi:bifunctional ADP-heptose synthase (sugar kinase/adenylyltransferase)